MTKQDPARQLDAGRATAIALLATAFTMGVQYFTEAYLRWQDSAQQSPLIEDPPLETRIGEPGDTSPIPTCVYATQRGVWYEASPGMPVITPDGDVILRGRWFDPRVSRDGADAQVYILGQELRYHFWNDEDVRTLRLHFIDRSTLDVPINNPVNSEEDCWLTYCGRLGTVDESQSPQALGFDCNGWHHRWQSQEVGEEDSEALRSYDGRRYRRIPDPSRREISFDIQDPGRRSIIGFTLIGDSGSEVHFSRGELLDGHAYDAATLARNGLLD